MSLGYEKAHAARRVRALNAQLPERLRLDLTAEWKSLEDEMAASRSAGAAELSLLTWRADVEGRIATRLANAPLEEANS